MIYGDFVIIIINLLIYWCWVDLYDKCPNDKFLVQELSLFLSLVQELSLFWRLLGKKMKKKKGEEKEEVKNGKRRSCVNSFKNRPQIDYKWKQKKKYKSGRTKSGQP